MERRRFLIAGSSLLLSACAPARPLGVYETREVAAPQWRVGDTWTYRRTDGYNKLPRGILTRRVMAAGPDGFHMVTLDEGGRLLDDAFYLSPGIQVRGTLSEDGPIIGRFNPPLPMYDFPLVAGKRWGQGFNRWDSNESRNYVSMSAQAQGWEDVSLGSKTYRALIITRFFNLGQKTPFHGNAYREDIEWYVPELRAPAMLRTVEEFQERTLRPVMTNGDRFVYQLESFELR